MSQGGPIDENYQRLATLCCIQKAKAQRIVASLLECGKLTKKSGKLSQKRAENEVKRVEKRIESASKAAQKREETREKNKQKQRSGEIEMSDRVDPTINHQPSTINHQPSTKGKKEVKVIASDDAPAPPDAVDPPGQEVLPPDGKATEVDQVQAAFDRYNRMARSEFCQGANDNGRVASLDFMRQGACVAAQDCPCANSPAPTPCTQTAPAIDGHPLLP